MHRNEVGQSRLSGSTWPTVPFFCRCVSPRCLERNSRTLWEHLALGVRIVWLHGQVKCCQWNTGGPTDATFGDANSDFLIAVLCLRSLETLEVIVLRIREMLDLVDM